MPRESIYRRHKPAVTPIHEKNDLSYWFVFSSNKLLISSDHNDLRIPLINDLCELQLSPIRTLYLGMLQERPCYCAEVSSNTAPDGMSFIDLRSLYGVLDEDIFLLAGKAIQIVNWDQTHQFCGRCGTPSTDLEGERAKKCPKCGNICYPRISPATITAIIKEDKILLAHAKAYRGNIHSLIAGFLEPGETLEECVQREIMEEVGLTVKNIKYFASQPWPYPNSMMIGFIAEYESGEITVDGTEIAQAAWFDANNLPELPGEMSIARQIINWYIKQNTSD